MKKTTVIIITVLLAGCRSLGSWYGGSDIVTTDRINLSEIQLNGYSVARLQNGGNKFDTITIDPNRIPLKSSLANSTRGIRFSRLKKDDLLFAINGGIFTKEKKPLGYFACNGIEYSPLNSSEGEGNFYLKPNGLLVLFDGLAEIMETSEFTRKIYNNGKIPDLAVQSGPLLLRQNIINENFTPGSSNKYIRTGVGINRNLIVFAISDKPVNLYDFALFFKETAHCSSALYLDGHIAGMYIPELNRKQSGRRYAVILYATQ